MFANCQLFGMDLAFPDVCLTPMPAPTPIPYPDIALGPTAIPNA
ncbi:PAAR-like domain-containing protein, partial [Cronobacter sakazakii]